MAVYFLSQYLRTLHFTVKNTGKSKRRFELSSVILKLNDEGKN